MTEQEMGKLLDDAANTINALGARVKELEGDNVRLRKDADSVRSSYEVHERHFVTHKEGKLQARVKELEVELADLRWFRDEVNKRVLPGESDTHDAARSFINGSMGQYRRMVKVVDAAKEFCASDPGHGGTTYLALERSLRELDGEKKSSPGCTCQEWSGALCGYCQKVHNI